MQAKEQLYYLINKFSNGEYTPSDFCIEFTRIFSLETDYRTLSKMEHRCFDGLSNMTCRFSEDEDDLKISHMYFSKEQIIEEVKRIKSVLAKEHTQEDTGIGDGRLLQNAEQKKHCTKRNH